MVELSEPQVWTVIAIFGASTVGLVTIVATSFMRVVNSGFAAMETKFEAMDSKFEAKFEALETKMDARFDAVHTKLEHLDRDVQAIARKVFPEAG